MRAFTLLLGILAAFPSASAQSNADFSGSWVLNEARSSIKSLPSAPARSLRVDQSAASLTVFVSAGNGEQSTGVVYSLAGKSQKNQVSGAVWNTATKWEGEALLANIIVTGPQKYSMDERWEKSRDGNLLTITRTVLRAGIESESDLVYQRPDFVDSAGRQPAGPPPVISSASRAPERAVISSAPRTPEPKAPAPDFVVPVGTHILLRLTNSVNTKRTVAGDKVYLETAMPIFVDRKLIIPIGSYVTGTVTESKEAGRVKGRSGLNLRFENLTLPNGISRDFRSRADSVDTSGKVDKTEGRIEGEGNKAGDAKTVGKTTAAGTGVGTIAGAAAGHLGMGAGIGAGAGALAGLAGVLASRGPEVVLQPGTTMELVLDRELRFTAEEMQKVY
jgi:hypothetical protein